MIICVTIFYSCTDDSWKSEIEDLRNEINSNTELIEKLQNSLTIDSLEELESGYEIHFSDGTSINIEDGSIPVMTIGENGNWFIDGIDTGTKAQGSDGYTPSITIGENGNWYIDNVDSGQSAQGENGVTAPNITHIVYSNSYFTFYFSDGTNIQVQLTPIPDFKNCYVSYDPIGSTIGNKEKFIVYIQNESNPIYYYGFQIEHDYNITDEIFYTNQYRIIKALVYEFNGISMIVNGETALASGESEFVYKTPSSDDFTGGFHGDEQFTDISFFIDGVKLTSAELASSFDLLGCSEFSYIQKSTLQETAVGGVPNPLHPIEAIHHKFTEISDSGYTTKNKVVWQDNLSIGVGYLSLSCVGTSFGGKGFVSDDSVIETFDQGGGHRLEGLYNNAHMWNETLGNSSQVNSEFDTYDNIAVQFIWDKSNYNKYYRNTGAVSVATNEEWNGTTVVKFLKR